MKLKFSITMTDTTFAYDKCIINEILTRSTTIYVHNLHSILFDIIPLYFSKSTLFSETKICSSNIRLKNLLKGGIIWFEVFTGDEVYDNYMRTVYGKIRLDVRVDWINNDENETSDHNEEVKIDDYRMDVNIESISAETDNGNQYTNNQAIIPSLQKNEQSKTNIMENIHTTSADHLESPKEHAFGKLNITKKNKYTSINTILKILHDNNFTESFIVNENAIFNRMFSTFFDPETAQKYNSSISQIWRLFKYVSKGSYACIFKFWFGLLILEHHYKQNYNVVRKQTKVKTKALYNRKHHSTDELSEHCQNEDQTHNTQIVNTRYTDQSFFTYYHNLYYYAIAPYANSLLTLLVKKRKKIDTNTTRSAVLSFLDIDDENLLIVNLSDKTDVQFVAFFDKVENQIVVSFRGTQTYYDAISDLDCEYQMFYDGYAHRGFVKIAELFIEKHLKSIKTLLTKRKNRGLLFTGQSLGGAISHVVSIITQRDKLLKHIDVKVVVFQSPPVVSKSLVNSENVTNILCGYDIISRLSFGSLLDLKYLSISTANFINTFSDYNVNDYIRDVCLTLQVNEINAKLYLPGKIFHIFEEDKVYYKLVNCEELENIIVHKKNFWDHSFSAMLNIFQNGCKETK